MLTRCAVALLVIAHSAYADEAPKVLTPEKAPERPAEKSVEPQDPAFAEHVDLNKVAEAWSGSDSEALTDLAVKLSAGERTLGRPNKQLPAHKLFEAALNTAAAKRDIKTLERLAAEANKAGHKELHEKAIILLRVAKSARAIDPLLTPSDKHSTETNIQLHLYNDSIKMARLNRDAEALKYLETTLTDNPHLTGATAMAMKKQIREAMDNLPKDDDESISLLRKMAAGSRAVTAMAPAKVGVVGVDTSGVTYDTKDVATASDLANTIRLPAGWGSSSSPITAGTLSVESVNRQVQGFSLNEGPAPKAGPRKPSGKVAKFTIQNAVPQSYCNGVMFSLICPDNGATALCLIKPDNKSYPFNIAYSSGTPAIRIYQVGGKAALTYSVANNGRYQFQVNPKDQNRIWNYSAP